MHLLRRAVLIARVLLQYNLCIYALVVETERMFTDIVGTSYGYA